MPPHAGDAGAGCLPPAPRPEAPRYPACEPAACDAAAADRFLSHEALAREPHSLRALAPLLQVRHLSAGAHSAATRQRV